MVPASTTHSSLQDAAKDWAPGDTVRVREPLGGGFGDAGFVRELTQSEMLTVLYTILRR